MSGALKTSFSFGAKRSRSKKETKFSYFLKNGGDPLPTAFNLVEGDGPLIPDILLDCWDQGNINSCVANEMAFLHIFVQLVQNNTSLFMPSRLFLYYNARKLESSIYDDVGCTIEAGVRAGFVDGACEERAWTYYPPRTFFCPYPLCFRDGERTKVLDYTAIEQTEEQIKTAICDGFPIICGFDVYDTFITESQTTGIMTMPGGDPPLGGHCMLICGYDDDESMFYCRNSWGPIGPFGGYFKAPYAFVTDPTYTFDLFTVTAVENNQLFGADNINHLQIYYTSHNYNNYPDYDDKTRNFTNIPFETAYGGFGGQPGVSAGASNFNILKFTYNLEHKDKFSSELDNMINNVQLKLSDHPGSSQKIFKYNPNFNKLPRKHVIEIPRIDNKVTENKSIVQKQKKMITNNINNKYFNHTKDQNKNVNYVQLRSKKIPLVNNMRKQDRSKRVDSSKPKIKNLLDEKKTEPKVEPVIEKTEKEVKSDDIITV